jgi:hypothetical protein
MTALARITDLGEGECPLHGPTPRKYTTTHITGCSTVFTNNLAQLVAGREVGEQDCEPGNKHISATLTGSSTVFAENLPVHRVADTGEGQGKDIYTTITGSPDVFNDGA